MSNEDLGNMRPPIKITPHFLKLENEAVAKAVNRFIRQDFVNMDAVFLITLEAEQPRLSHIIKERRVDKNYVANMRTYCRKFAAASLNPDPNVRKFQEAFDKYAYDVWYPFHADLGERIVAVSKKDKLEVGEIVARVETLDKILSKVLPSKKDALDFHFKQDDFFVEQLKYYRSQEASSQYALTDAEGLSFRRAVFSFRVDEWNRRYK